MGSESELSHWRGRGDGTRIGFLWRFLDLVNRQFSGRASLVFDSGLDAKGKIFGVDAIINDYADIRVEDIVAIDAFLRLFLF